MDERELERLMATDFSVGTEEFAKDLLQRALETLGQEQRAKQGWRVLEDEEIDLLAAAGNPDTLPPEDPEL